MDDDLRQCRKHGYLTFDYGGIIPSTGPMVRPPMREALSRAADGTILEETRGGRHFYYVRERGVWKPIAPPA
mgnify:CR=1 FL=1